MLLKAGVDISRLNREIRRSLNHVEKIYSNYRQELVITSTYEGVHSASSLHYSNDAIDCRLPTNNLVEIVREIKSTLGKDYDVVIEVDHLHIEYDPE